MISCRSLGWGAKLLLQTMPTMMTGDDVCSLLVTSLYLTQSRNRQGLGLFG